MPAFVKGDVLIGLHQWETITPDNVSFVLNHPDLASFSPVKYFLIRDGELTPRLLTDHRLTIAKPGKALPASPASPPSLN